MVSDEHLVGENHVADEICQAARGGCPGRSGGRDGRSEERGTAALGLKIGNTRHAPERKKRRESRVKSAGFPQNHDVGVERVVEMFKFRIARSNQRRDRTNAMPPGRVRERIHEGRAAGARIIAGVGGVSGQADDIARRQRPIDPATDTRRINESRAHW